MSFLLFLLAASLIALSPGPGIFYVAARTLAGGRGEGLASSVGTGIGGFVHVLAGAAGVSALVMASAEAFALLKIAGALYLIWLGLKTIREGNGVPPATVTASVSDRVSCTVPPVPSVPVPPLMPVPLKVPPIVTGFKFREDAFVQKLAGSPLKEGSGVRLTVTKSVQELVQPPVVTE